MKHKKLLGIVAVVVGVLLVGGIAGVAFAANSSTTSQSLWARVATILGIDQSKLESAVSQAQKEMQSEALDNYLKSLVENGTITQAQADQYKQWYQSKPDMPLGIGPGFGGMGRGHGFGMGGMCLPPTTQSGTTTQSTQ